MQNQTVILRLTLPVAVFFAGVVMTGKTKQ